jgi:hypothetical protein
MLDRLLEVDLAEAAESRRLCRPRDADESLLLTESKAEDEAKNVLSLAPGAEDASDNALGGRVRFAGYGLPAATAPAPDEGAKSERRPAVGCRCSELGNGGVRDPGPSASGSGTQNAASSDAFCASCSMEPGTGGSSDREARQERETAAAASKMPTRVRAKAGAEGARGARRRRTRMAARVWAGFWPAAARRAESGGGVCVTRRTRERAKVGERSSGARACGLGATLKELRVD